VAKFVEIKFVYDKNIKRNDLKERLIKSICELTSTKFVLPDKIIVINQNLGHHVLGETILDSKNSNKIKLNANLDYKETLIVLSHELIHLSQIAEKRLTFNKKGDYIWEGKVCCNYATIKSLDYNIYLQLPWEQDVAKKQQKLVDFLLKK